MSGQSDFASISRRQFLTTSAAAASSPLLAASAEARPTNSAQAALGTFRLVREIPVQSGYDLLVAGGGPAGVAAAVERRPKRRQSLVGRGHRLPGRHGHLGPGLQLRPHG